MFDPDATVVIPCEQSARDEMRLRELQSARTDAYATLEATRQLYLMGLSESADVQTAADAWKAADLAVYLHVCRARQS